MIAWDQTDLSLFPHDPTAVGSWNYGPDITTAVPASITSAPSNATGYTTDLPSSSAILANSSAASDQSGNAGGELSAGAQAGIGVGVAVIVVLAVVVIVMWWRARGKESKDSAGDVPRRTDMRGMFGEDVPHLTGTHELFDGSALYEKPDQDRVPELNDNVVARELDSGIRTHELVGDIAAEHGEGGKRN